MRAIWKGAISFGLVNVPVKLYSATSSHDLSLHQVHDEDGGRIRYERRCEVCKQVVAYKNIDKAYDDGTQTVVLTKEDLDALPAEKSREIEVVEFVPAEQIDPMRLDTSYYLEPEERALKPYTLLRRTLEETDRAAIVRFALRQRTRLGILRVRDNALVLQTMLWDDEVRAPEFDVLDQQAKVTAKELKMAEQLVDSLSGDLDTIELTDEYQEQLRTLVDAKLEQGEAIDTEKTFGVSEDESDEGGEVVDLMEALRRSVDARKKKSGGAAKKAAKSSGSKRKSG